MFKKVKDGTQKKKELGARKKEQGKACSRRARRVHREEQDLILQNRGGTDSAKAASTVLRQIFLFVGPSPTNKKRLLWALCGLE